MIISKYINNRIFDVVAFDADDTLWHSQKAFHKAIEAFVHLFPDNDRQDLIKEVYQTQSTNRKSYGYGSHSLYQAMLATAHDITTAQKLPTSLTQEITKIYTDLYDAPIELLPDVQKTLVALREQWPQKFVLITKGQEIEQREKLRRSGLRSFFSAVDVVPDKTPEIYQSILEQWGSNAQNFVMIGNSVASDIEPVLSIGGYAIHVPYKLRKKEYLAALQTKYPNTLYCVNRFADLVL